MSSCNSEEVGNPYPIVLPSLDFSSEGEDLGEHCEEEETQVFSRSSHIKTLGLCLGNSESGSSISVHELESNSIPSISSSTDILDPNGSTEELDGTLSTHSWEIFKNEFSDKLREAEKAVAEEENGGPVSPPAPAVTRDDLFIEMITAFHDSKLTHEEPEEIISSSDLEIGISNTTDVSRNGSDYVSKYQLSPTKPRKSLLSLSTLEAIQESDLDWSLENIDKGAESGLECNGEDSESFTESYFGSPFSPHSGTAWEVEKNVGSTSGSGGKKNEDSLMEQLQQLSRSQANGSVGFGDSVIMSGVTPPAQLVQVAHPGKEDKGTVFIDLRPREDPNSPKGGSGMLSPSDPTLKTAANDGDSSDSGSDEEDLYTWAAQRRIVKGQQTKTAQDTTETNFSTTASTLSTNSAVNTAPSFTDLEVSHLPVEPETPPTSSISSSLASVLSSACITNSKPPPTHSSICSSTSSVHNLCTVHSVPALSPCPTPSNKIMNTTAAVTDTDITSTQDTNEYKQSRNSLSASNKNKSTEIKSLPSRSRNRNSSSFSDGDVPTSSECATSQSGNSEDQQDRDSPTKIPSDPNSGKGKKSKKKGRKSKKIHKKDSSSESGSQRKERSQASQKRRAHILQRIRKDSLNTSSDEEHSLSSNSSESLGTWDSVFTEHVQTDLTKEDRNAQRSVDEIKEELRKRIFSKKPPTYFDTPGTEPIYHEELSFSDSVVDHILCGSSTGMLVVPLTCHSLLALPPKLLDNVPVDIQGVLFCLIITWLVTQAAESEVKNATMAQEMGEGFAPTLSSIPFDVTGIQWTLLDGHSSLLIAVQRRKDVISDSTSTFSDIVERYLTTTTFGEALHHLVRLEQISDAMDDSKLAPVFKLPLKSLFSFQEDVSALSTPVSFYWYSSYHQSCLPSPESLLSEHKVSTTVFTLHKSSLRDTVLVFTVFLRALLSGLSIVGIRTAYGKQEDSILSVSSSPGDSMCLAVALRGPDAIQGWMEIVGPQDSKLAKITDPSSLTAKFGSDLIETLRTQFRSGAALAKWFGGRACLKTCSVLGMSDSHTKSERRKRQRVRFSETQSESEDSISSPMLLEPQFPPLVSNRPRLIAPAYVKCLLVISPSVPLAAYGSILACCSKLGFDVFGCKRVRLNAKKAALLDIPGEYLAHFTPSSTPLSPQVSLDSVSSHPLGSSVAVKQPLAPLPSAIFIVGQENAKLHSYALQNLISDSLKSLIGSHPSVVLPSGVITSPSALVHVSSFTEDKLRHFGSFSPTISQSSTVPESLLERDSHSHEFKEELCFVAIPGSQSLPSCVNLLNANYHVDLLSELRLHESVTSDTVQHDVEPELIGLKIVPQLPRFHSKKLCPFTSSELLYTRAIQLLTDKPTSLLVFRGVACSKQIQGFIKGLQRGSSHIPTLESQLHFILSRTPSEAIQLTSFFFSGKELFSDPTNWALAPYYPHSWVHEADILQSFICSRENLFSVVQLPMSQMTLSLKILDKLTRSGFQLAGLSSVEVSMNKEGQVESQGAKLVACVERSNAVWAAEQVVRPFTKDRAIDSIKWSANFDSTISDIKFYFTEGIWCRQLNSILKDYSITQLTQDHLSGLVLPEGCWQSLKPASMMSYVSPLNERTAILLLPSLLENRTEGSTSRSGGTSGFVQVLEALHKAGFQFCGLKVVLLSKDSARELKILCCAEVELESILSGPCLAVVLERDNAASCFQLILKSVLNNFSHGDHMLSLFADVLVPPDNKKAKQILQFLHCL